jgi:hypothetical protein
VALVRLRDDPATRVYVARRRAEGKSPREIRRCVKRAIARHLFKLLQQLDRFDVEVVRVCQLARRRRPQPGSAVGSEGSPRLREECR